MRSLQLRSQDVDYRYFKLKGADGDTYLVRHDERSNTWELTMFRTDRVGDQGMAVSAGTSPLAMFHNAANLGKAKDT
jgi:hypothetical protein